MSVAGFVVALADDVHEDDAERTLDAIRQLRGVASVEAVGLDAIPQQIGAMRMHTALTNGVVAALRTVTP